MMNSQEPFQPNSSNLSNSTQSRNLEFTSDKQNLFSFLQKEEKSSSSSSSPPFFSENGLSQDIIQITQAEPDICLEVFYALYNILWPQIESQSNVSFKDAWTKFIGGSIFKGTLCPPERLITERRIRDMKKLLSQNGGENQIFHDLDQAVSSISHLREKVQNHKSQILQEEEIMESLSLVQEFYQSYRNKVKGLVQAIIEKEQKNVSHTAESDALEDLLEPKAIMMSDIFAHHWAYRISRNQAQILLSFDASGRHLKSNLNDPANHRVIALPENAGEPLVFFKANGNPPIQPEKDFMLYSLYRHLQIPVPETALVLLTGVFEANSDYFYAIQASEAVVGESPLKACQDQETTFDHEAYVYQTIGAILTNPSDGSFKNFKYSPVYQTFISIDNDLVFKPELIGKDQNKVINVKSMLYLFSQMDLPIPESIKIFFTTLDPHLITLSWLKDLSKKNQDYQLLYTRLAFQRTRCIYQNLLPQSEVPPLATCLQKKVEVDPELHSDTFYPQILLSKDLLTRFAERLQLIERIFLTNRSVNTQTLFEGVSPVLGKYYRKLRFEFSDPEEALEALWGVKKNDIDYSFLSSLLDYEEFKNLLNNKKSYANLLPNTFFNEYKSLLASGEAQLDKFLRRHNERKKKNSLNLQAALDELRLLIQENLLNSQSPRDIVDFCYSLSKSIESQSHLIKEITSLLCNLPHPELKWLLILENFFLRPDRLAPKDLIPSSVEVIGALMKQRTLLLFKSESQYLFDQQGDIQRNISLTGRSRVTCFPQIHSEFYLKQYPEWPGYEFASTMFMRSLGVGHLPYQDLLLINNYPTLLTQKANGDPVIGVWHNSEIFNNLDPFHTGFLIISAMLINPEDGKEDNFILSPDRKYLIPIDNDHCFLPSTFQKEGSLWNAFTVNTALQTKTILFCLDEMYKPIPPEVQQHILSLDFDLLLTKWMTELDKLENKFNNLVDQNQRNKFLEKGTVMRIPFYKQFIQTLHWKVHKIQALFKSASRLTPFDLLKAVEPFAARCYENSFKSGSNLKDRFHAVTRQLYTKTAIDGSRVSVLNTRTMMEIINISEKDLQNDSMFQKLGPVDALELLNHLIQVRRQKIVLEEEILFELDGKKQQNSWINLFGNSPAETALKAFFTNPREGLVLKRSKLITSSKLSELFAQAPDKVMGIRFLSLLESPLLTKKEIRILVEGCPNIEYLNVSGCIKLKEIITGQKEWPLLVRFEAQDCANLEKFISESPIKILQIGTDRKIEIFVAKSTIDLFTISKKRVDFWFSLKNRESFQIKSQDKNFTSDNFRKSVFYSQRWSEVKNYFRDIKVTIGMSSISSGEDLETFVTNISFDSSNVNITDIKNLVVFKLIHLKSLDLSCTETNDEGLEVITKGNWPLLETLKLFNTNVTNKSLTSFLFYANWPQLKEIDLPSDWDSADIDLAFCFIKKDFSKVEQLVLNNYAITLDHLHTIFMKCRWPRLKYLNISNNNISLEGIEILALADCPLLEGLEIENIKITPKGIESIVSQTKWQRLKHLNVSHNEIYDEGLSILLLAEWPFFESLNLSQTKISLKGAETIVRQPKYLRLKCLNVSHNEISDEGVSVLALAEWSELENLNLSKTMLSLKGIDKIMNESKLPQMLKYLNVSSNEIFDEGLSALALKEWLVLEELNLKDTKITQQGIETIVNLMKLPNLKKLDISENNIFDEGLSKLASGNWPLFQHLAYYHTKVTEKGHMTLLENFKWPHLNHLEHSLNESFYNSNGSLPEIILATMPISYKSAYQKEQTFLVIALNTTWFNSKEIYLEISDDDVSEKVILVPRNKLDQFESIKLSLDTSPKLKPLQLILWPPNLSTLEIISKNGLLSNEIKIESLFSKKCPSIKVLHLSKTGIQKKGLEILINRLNPSTFKKLDISYNSIQGEGLALLTSTEWPLLESLNLRSTGFSFKGLEDSIRMVKLLPLMQSGASPEEICCAYKEIPNEVLKRLAWPNLKQLDVSENTIQDEGLEMLASVKWPLLEELQLQRSWITSEGIKALVAKSDWPNLRRLDLSSNRIGQEGFKVLSDGKWPLLEDLHLSNMKSTKGIEILIIRSEWPSLKLFDISWNNDLSFEGFPLERWDSLEVLDLSFSQIALKDVKILIKNSSWPNLKEIILDGSIEEKDEKDVLQLLSEKWPEAQLAMWEEGEEMDRASNRE